VHDIILSPPFSNLKLLSLYPNTTRILGTYTLKKRRGLWRVLTTLKKTERGWVNNVGLRNGGIDSIPNKPHIISIAELEDGDWETMLLALSEKYKIQGVELNISCPNANVKHIDHEVLTLANTLFKQVIVKVPHSTYLPRVFSLVEQGATTIHISNTKRTPEGALSGLDLQKNNLDAISELKKWYPSVKVIGGGGIYSLGDLERYRSAGADHFSLSTILLNPIKTNRIVRGYNALQSF
jgi:dihydroorotate dehydrogenase